MSKDPNHITFKNIGPIKELEFDIVPGSINVAKGPNGSGKTTIINAVNRLQTENKSIKLTSHDCTTGGQVDGLGCRIKISRGGSNRQAGECVVESIEGDLSIADFVDPGMKSDSAADAKRIKALTVLTGAKADPSMFYGLFEGGKEEFLSIVSEESRESDDLLEMAAKIKRDIESHARQAEDAEKTAAAEVVALKEMIEGVDLNAECDEQKLDAAVDNARDELSRLRQLKGWFNDNREDYEKAKSVIGKVRPNIKQMQEYVNAMTRDIDELEQKLREMKQELAVQESKLESAIEAESQADLLEALVKKYESQSEPTDEDIQSAEQSVADAKAAMELGVQIRQAKSKQPEIEKYEQRRGNAEQKASDLRDAAKGTEDVLAEAIKQSCSLLKVDEEFRLVVDHPNRGECYFSELSEGERWRLGIEIAIESFKKKGSGGLLGIPQEAWEGLDYDNRKAIADAIDGTDLAILTAEASQVKADKIEVETVK